MHNTQNCRTIYQIDLFALPIQRWCLQNLVILKVRPSKLKIIIKFQTCLQRDLKIWQLPPFTILSKTKHQHMNEALAIRVTMLPLNFFTEGSISKTTRTKYRIFQTSRSNNSRQTQISDSGHLHLAVHPLQNRPKIHLPDVKMLSVKRSVHTGTYFISRIFFSERIACNALRNMLAKALCTFETKN
jgi:hypothetical protein